MPKTPEFTNTICRFSDCGRPVICKGYCKGHYYQSHRKSELTPIVLHSEKTQCRWPGCDEQCWRVDYCANHARKVVRYGLSPEDVVKIAGKTCCDICGKSAKLNIDHDHATGRVRGMLCMDCNIRMAVFDDKVFLAAAQRYVVDVDA